eukprot:GHVU01057507.1.p1 GENE.GHVU01057507.1~~GHVU01057507.1.p1  ORF type:complete len:144 (-),score=3.41 GHVU01057507.1:1169-1600(-)
MADYAQLSKHDLQRLLKPYRVDTCIVCHSRRRQLIETACRYMKDRQPHWFMHIPCTLTHTHTCTRLAMHAQVVKYCTISLFHKDLGPLVEVQIDRLKSGQHRYSEFSFFAHIFHGRCFHPHLLRDGSSSSDAGFCVFTQPLRL